MEKDVIKPQKRDTVLLNEKLNSSNIDETGIEESNKKILLRQLNPSFKFIVNDNSKIYKTTAKKILTNQSKFKSPGKITKVRKIHLNFNNFQTNEKPKKSYPEDNLRGSFAKTQGREYERRKFIYVGNNYNNNKINININDENSNDKINYQNGKINPIFLFTEGKKDDFRKQQLIKSPVVKKINFLKTIFGENDDY